MTLKTIAQSSMVRHSGPTRSMLHASTIPPDRLTRPNVGRSAEMPQTLAGDMMDPRVSVPMPNATHPAAVADVGPAEDPLDPTATFQGLLVRPRYHWSPIAKRPDASFAIRIAPAFVEPGDHLGILVDHAVFVFSGTPGGLGSFHREQIFHAPGDAVQRAFVVSRFDVGLSPLAASVAGPSRIVTAHKSIGSYFFSRSR